MKKKKIDKKQKESLKELEKKEIINKDKHLVLNKYALIAAFLNLILVGLGYIFIKKYKKAIISFIVYIISYLIIFYIATFYPILIWLGIPLTLFFVYDVYRSGKNASEYLFIPTK